MKFVPFKKFNKKGYPETTVSGYPFTLKYLDQYFLSPVGKTFLPCFSLIASATARLIAFLNWIFNRLNQQYCCDCNKAQNSADRKSQREITQVAKFTS
jgi:hypothetical protein